MRKRLFAIWIVLFLFHLQSSAQESLEDSLGISELPDTARISKLIALGGSSYQNNMALAWKCMDRAMALSSAANDHYRKADIFRLRGTLHWAKADHDAAMQDYTAAKQQYVANGDSLGIAKSDNNLGLVYWSLSYYDLAMESFLRALPYFEKHPDTSSLATLYNNLGNVYNRGKQSENAAFYYRKAFAMLSPRGNSPALCMVANNLGLVLVAENKTTEALKLYALALQGYKEIGQVSGQTSVLTNMGSAYVQLEQFQEAKIMYDQALDLSLKSGNDYDIAVAYLKECEYSIKTKDYKAAIPAGLKSLEYGKGPNALDQLFSTHEALSLAYENTGDFANALLHHKKGKALQDTAYSEAKSRAIAEMQLKYDTAVKDQQIEHLAQESQLAQLRILVLAAVLALILVSAVLIFLRQRAILRREKLIQEKDKAMFETQAALHDAESRAAEAERQRLRDELSFKSREITTLAMNIVRKNELLEALDSEMRVLRKGAKEGGEDKLREIGLLLAQNLNSEKERKEIELFIDEAQQNFFMELDRRFPDLSIKEKRICVMIRQGLSSKEISIVFNINTSSVEVSRYRIRKKLNLDPSIDLQAFLGEF